MRRMTKGAVLASAAVMLMSSTVSAAETVTYKGMGTYEVMRAVLPLANGSAAVQFSNDIVATINPSESGFIFGDCAGLGYLSVEGSYSGDVYCTFTETGDDSFDIKGTARGDSGSVEIIGGSGKWTGATGKGSIKRKYSAGNRGSYEYEFSITTP
ncbi:MAG: hypothetical protein BMS9Abin14_144 [Gammaproteobacteria bacterium]|nr:MAG: hypothetical protein BMS9Abin14_144 [Gammaproteobacteria bacterium]